MQFGYEPVSINQIAQEAGVTKASVYYYFGSKAALFTAAVAGMMKRVAVLSAQILDQQVDLRVRLERVATAKMARSHIEFETLMREAMPSLSEEQRNSIRQAEQAIHDILADCFRKAMEAGEIVGGKHPVLLAHAFSSLLMMGNRETDLKDALSGSSLPDQIVDLFWNGIAPNGA